jgi:carnitine O-acetyltransferase
MWLQECLDDFSYHTVPVSVVINQSPYFGFKPQPAHLPQTPAARAAGITRATMLFRQSLRSGKSAPDTIKGIELCMDTYRWMFDACRIPGTHGVDWVTSHANCPNPHEDLGHVIVIRKNRFWKINAEVGGKVLGMGDLISQIQYIYDHSTDEYPAIGALTADDRDIWGKNYDLLSSIPRNAALFREIHSSAFVVSLDDSTPPPENDVDVSRALWHGTLPSPTNSIGVSRGISSRFVDKIVQFIIFDNSIAGMMGEHSVIDGTSYARLCDEVLGFLANPESDFQLSPSSSVAATPEPLDFDLTSIPEIHEAISKSQQSVQDLASSKSLSFLKTNYGKAVIKGFGVGPDGWVQMVIQLAYARLAERFGGENEGVRPWPASTYEAATLRRFYKGRLATIMMMSAECVAFVQAMLGKSATRDEKAQLLRDAVKKHQQLAQGASMGETVDEHMLGLHLCLSSSMPLPAMFTDSLYARSSNWMLYTSSLSSKHLGLFGWGAYTEGLIVAYVTADDYLQYTVTSPTELPITEFTEELKKAAEELYELFASS